MGSLLLLLLAALCACSSEGGGGDGDEGLDGHDADPETVTDLSDAPDGLEVDAPEPACTPPADPAPGELLETDGFVLERGFFFPDPGAGSEALVHAATVNALATLIYFNVPTEVPVVTVESTEVRGEALWVDYSAKIPEPDPRAGVVVPFERDSVPMEPYEIHARLIHQEIPECPLDPLDPAGPVYSGLQHLLSYLAGTAPPECLELIPMTEASLRAERVHMPDCLPLPSYERWLEDCTLHVAMFFNRLSEDPDPYDIALQDMQKALILLSGPSPGVDMVETRNEEPWPGVAWRTFEADCMEIGGVSCVDVQVELVARDQDHADQLELGTAFWDEAGALFAEADVVYWAGHGFSGLGLGGLTRPLGDGCQLIVLAQCSGASNSSVPLFSQKPGLGRDLDLVGFQLSNASLDAGASFTLERFLAPEVQDLRSFVDELNEAEERNLLLVGSLQDPCMEP